MPNYTILVQKSNNGVIEYATAFTTNAKTKAEVYKRYIIEIFHNDDATRKKLIKIYGNTFYAQIKKIISSNSSWTYQIPLAKKVLLSKSMPHIVILTKELKPVDSFTSTEIKKIDEKPRLVAVRRKRA